MRTPLLHEAQLHAALQRAKHGAGAFASNLFAGPEALDKWLGQGRLEHLEAGDASLVMLKEPGFLRLFHLAPDLPALTCALSRLAQEGLRTPVVTDLVGRAQEVGVLADLHAGQGFRPHRRLVRMAAPGPPVLLEAARSPGPDPLGPQAAGEVLAFLAARLDPLAEQVPDLEAVISSCARGEVLGCHVEGELAGVLMMAPGGATALLSYWFVAEWAQGRGLGSRLIRGFFRASAGRKRLLLWVLQDNASAIAKYEHYGFRQDGLQDQIMVRGPGEEAWID